MKTNSKNKAVTAVALETARRGHMNIAAEMFQTIEVTADGAPDGSGDVALQEVVDKVPPQQRALSALKEHLDDSEKLYKTLGQIIKAERGFLESKAHQMSSGVGDKQFFDFSESGWAFGGAAMFAQALAGVLSGLDQGKLAESVVKAFGPVRPHPAGLDVQAEVTASKLSMRDETRLIDIIGVQRLTPMHREWAIAMLQAMCKKHNGTWKGLKGTSFITQWDRDEDADAFVVKANLHNTVRELVKGIVTVAIPENFVEANVPAKSLVKYDDKLITSEQTDKKLRNAADEYKKRRDEKLKRAGLLKIKAK